MNEPADARAAGRVTLAFDIGGTRLKAGLLSERGAILGDQVRVDTPHPAPPDKVVDALVGLTEAIPAGGPGFDRVSVGFPGVVRQGRIVTAPNLGTGDWHGFDLAGALSARLDRPVRVLNDGSVQGLGVIAGRGFEIVITLGTGMGFAMFQDGRLLPHLELSQHVVWQKKTYDQYLGNAVLEKLGDKRWNKHVARALEQIRMLTNFDTLHIGGGNAKHIQGKLPGKVRIVPNTAGITGGVRLWDARLDESFDSAVVAPIGNLGGV